MPTNVDSVDKIVKTYFSCVTNEAFNYKGVTYEPRRLYVSPLLLRGFTCPSACGGCCPRFSLDYLPSEERSSLAQPRSVLFNRTEHLIYSDMQKDHSDKKCRNLNKQDGRCGIYEVRPFSCDFELIRFIVSSNDDKRTNSLTQKLFGRGWQMMRIDGERGSLCSMTPPSQETVNDVIRKLNRLKDWTDYFSIKTKVPAILDWVNSVKTFENISPLHLDKFGNVM